MRVKIGGAMEDHGHYCSMCDTFSDAAVKYDGEWYCPTCEDLYFGPKEHMPRCDQCGERDMYAVVDNGEWYCRRCFARMEMREVEEPEKCYVPLSLQEKLLTQSFYDTLTWIMTKLQDDDDFIDELEALAERRLREGYQTYGSRMYGWDRATRRQNMMEELADLFCYASSGDY